jgi:hypothetical protein
MRYIDQTTSWRTSSIDEFVNDEGLSRKPYKGVSIKRNKRRYKNAYEPFIQGFRLRSIEERNQSLDDLHITQAEMTALRHPELQKERELPKAPADTQLLVNVSVRGHESVQYDEFYTDDGSYLDSGYEIGTEATAWRPLPEPYKAESEDKE